MLNTLTGFEETWLELHTIKQELRTVIVNTLHLGIPTWRTGELVRREQRHRRLV